MARMTLRIDRIRALLVPRSRSAERGEQPPRASGIILCMALAMLGLVLLAAAIQFLIETLFPLLAAA